VSMPVLPEAEVKRLYARQSDYRRRARQGRLVRLTFHASSMIFTIIRSFIEEWKANNHNYNTDIVHNIENKHDDSNENRERKSKPMFDILTCLHIKMPIVAAMLEKFVSEITATEDDRRTTRQSLTMVWWKMQKRVTIISGFRFNGQKCRVRVVRTSKKRLVVVQRFDEPFSDEVDTVRMNISQTGDTLEIGVRDRYVAKRVPKLGNVVMTRVLRKYALPLVNQHLPIPLAAVVTGYLSF
jgi:hypothetical protein